MPLQVSSLPVVLEALECSGTIVGVIDATGPDFLMLDLNAPFERFWGGSRDAILGQPFASLARPGAEQLPEIKAAMSRHAPFRGSLRCVSAAGEERRLGLHLIPSHDKSSPTRSYVLVGRDITEEQRLAEDRSAVQRLLLRSFMITDQALAILSEDRIVMANGRLGALLGVPHAALIGQSMLDFVPHRFHSAIAEERSRADGAGAVCDVPVEFGLPQNSRASVLHFVRLDQAGASRNSILTVLAAPAPTAAAAAPLVATREVPQAEKARPHHGSVFVAGTMKEAGTFLRLTGGTSDPQQQVELLHATLKESVQPLVLTEIGVPETGTRAWAEAYLEAFINLPEMLRRRLIPIFKINASSGLPVTTIHRLSQCCAGLGLSVGAVGTPPFSMAEWRPAVLAIDAASCDYGPKFNSFVNLIHAYRAQLLVCGVADPAEANTLARRGVDILTLA